ncbi:MAG: hypothetical protein ER33_08040 [Cyanobium sp. CACIAM 14]|nr:MAG: hypothetical protein ER33_08040 [Cyanobium sp. CACIAM 14]
MGAARGRNQQAGLLAALGMALAGCSSSTREVAIQNARTGDLLVEAGGHRVELVRPFQPGVANGQYKGVVKVSPADAGGPPQLHEVSAVCSVEGQPGWPTYDNIYGNPINDPSVKAPFSAKDRWQILYHFDGRVEKIGALAEDGWASRLKDNLCRKGDFNDTVKRPDSKS